MKSVIFFRESIYIFYQNFNLYTNIIALRWNLYLMHQFFEDSISIAFAGLEGLVGTVGFLTFIFLIVSLWQLTWYSWLQMFKFSSHNVPTGHSIINSLSLWHIKNFEQSVWCFTKTVPWTGSVHIASGSARGSMDELKINAEKRWQQLAWNELKKIITREAEN